MHTPDSVFERALALQRAGDTERAQALLQRVVSANPSHHAALFSLAGIDLAKQDWAAAAERLTRAVELAPSFAPYHSNLALAYRRLGDAERAAAALVRALELNPEQVEASFQLGLLLLEKGEAAAAAVCLAQAEKLRPQSFSIQHALARALVRCRQYAAAAVHCQRALALAPNELATAQLLAFVLLEQRSFDDALRHLVEALAHNPGSSRLLEYLGHALRSLGRVPEAMAAYRRALAANPRDHVVHSALVHTATFDPASGEAEILREARAWGRAHASPVRRLPEPLPRPALPGRRLRLGYVSPNFSSHCQHLFMLPVLRHHDHTAFEIVCYADHVDADALTLEHRAHAEHWHDVAALGDTELAQQIRRDGIDVLVDLTLHMPNSRLRTFAAKPAPVQLSWLGYPGTTGVDAIDYRITDPWLDPEQGEPLPYSERSLCLRHTFWCYDPGSLEPRVTPLPALARGQVTFGCLNDFCKLNPETLALWSRVLNRAPRSELLLLAPHGSARQSTLAVLGALGVGPERVQFSERLPRSEYLALYGRIDVALDCLPYNGHTTSLDAFWMGVPVVTLVGSTVVGRAGLSQAKNLGLVELVAASADEFVEIALGLSRDLERLSLLRSGLRARMQASPLMDAATFTREIERVYRHAWQRWCSEQVTASVTPALALRPE